MLDPAVKAELIKVANEYVKKADRATGPYSSKTDTELFKQFYQELAEAVEEKAGNVRVKHYG